MDAETTADDEGEPEAGEDALSAVKASPRNVSLATMIAEMRPRRPAWAARLTDEDKRGLNPLFTSNITP